jgi:hypothetical protein
MNPQAEGSHDGAAVRQRDSNQRDAPHSLGRLARTTQPALDNLAVSPREGYPACR